MDLRREALLMLENRGTVLETARKVSCLIKQHGIDGAVIGGVAVFLHGYARTTRDVDVLVRQPLADMVRALEQAGATVDPKRREFLLDGVTVQLVSEDLTATSPRDSVEIDGVLTVGLADLIAMELRSGMDNLARAQDIADVVGLIRERELTGQFAAGLDRALRGEFRKLVRAVRREQGPVSESGN